LRAPGEFFIFVGKMLHHFRPRNISAGERQDRYRPCRGCGADYSPKKSTAGPPSKIWIGSFSCSYS
jgi:hypothetical protein